MMWSDSRVMRHTILVILAVVVTICDLVPVVTSKDNEGLDARVGIPAVGGQPDFGFYLTRHSQTNKVPKCPKGSVLWQGYSLLNAQVKGLGQGNFQLGSSCLTQFTLKPVSCGNNDITCSSTHVSTSWLSTKAQAPVIPIKGNSIRDHISRCVLCDVPGYVMAFHSQSKFLPPCPGGWESLWTGYSFATTKTSALASPESCLENFRTNPIIKCSSKGSTCSYPSSSASSFWMAALDVDKKKPSNPSDRVGRCRVCIKKTAKT